MKVRCPYHEDVNPSCEVYENGGYCFVCQKFVSLGMLGLTQGSEIREVEDVAAKMPYIKSLPVRNIRGFNFPVDQDGYYIVWPEGVYYKRRNFTGSRYYSPKRNPEPPFWVRRGSSKDTLWVVEGQINALSIAAAVPGDVISPGGAGQFKENLLLPEELNYANIFLVTDKDKAGTEAGIRLKGALQAHNPFVSILLVDPEIRGDCNDIYVKYGAEGLKKEIAGWLQTRL